MCGRPVAESFQFCPYCGEKMTPRTFQNHQSHSLKSEQDSTARRLIATLLLIFYFPLGLPYMWIMKPFSKKTRWIISLAFLSAILLGFTMIIIWTTLPGYSH
jgi:uncharacterized membrane protein YvbJ